MDEKMNRQDNAAKQSYPPILCERCHHIIADVTDIRPFREVEPRFLSSVYRPSDMEILRLKEAFNEGEQEIKQYDERITILRQILNRLERAKSDAVTANRQHRAAIYVQRRIPVEVWGHIFSILCLDLHDYSFNIDPSTQLSTQVSPFRHLPAILVSQVCVRWNAIAKSTPSIWSSIRVDLGGSKFNLAIPRKIYLSNSKGYPLKLRFEGTVARMTEQTLDIWKELSEHLCRSGELIMATNFLQRSAETLTPVHGLKLPNLHSFYEQWNSPDVQTWPWLWQAIAAAPQLVRFSSHRLVTNPCFSQLTAWELWGPLHNMRTFLDVLQNCRHLKSLELIRNSFLKDSGTSREVTLPSLQQLWVDVTVGGEYGFSTIAQSLVLPSLISCRIQYKLKDSALPTTLLTFVRRSWSLLKRLELAIREGESHPSFILDLLQAAPELTHFEFSLAPKKGADNETVASLFSRLKEELNDFLPKLSYLSVESWDVKLTTQLAEQALKVVSSRRESSHPLMEFRLVRWRTIGFKDFFVMEPQVLERRRVLERGGARIVIEDRTTEMKRHGFS